MAMSIVNSSTKSGYTYNAQFSYNSTSFNVNVTIFYYGWELASTGTAKGRQAQTIYPWRTQQTDLHVTLIFRDVNEYRNFAEFVRSYHLAATQGSSMPKMTFSSTVIGGGISYQVIIPSIQQSYDIKMSPAPTLPLVMSIVKDQLDTADTSSSQMSGDAYDLVGDNKVTSGDVASSGDSAFTVGTQ